MKSGTHLRTGVVVLFVLLAIAVQPSAWGQTFTTFDPPGSQITAPGNINPAGQIVGSYFDSTFAMHGFLRDNDGTITSFDVPGFLATVLITPQGVVVGLYFDATGSHIFERAKNGTITTLEFPSPGAFVFAVVVNTAGAIGGGFIDPKGIVNGFVRSPGGNFTLFDAPNALPSFFGGPSSVNDSGIVTGFFYDGSQNGDLRVFLRDPNGVFSSFDAPQLETFPGAAAINSSGAVAGNVQNTVCGTSSCTTTLVSFLRAANGTVKPVNDPQVVQGAQAVQGTGVVGINPAGVMIGFYSDGNGVQHGF